MNHTSNQPPQTLDQRRANHAWEAIEAAKKLPKKIQGKEYGGHAKKLPTRIMTAGLGQALAFLLAKAGDPKSPQHKAHIKLIHDHLSDWVINQRPMKAAESGSLLQSIVKGNSEFLRRATDEVMAYLLWLNRFAEAEGLTDEGDDA
jgi:CRISPR-associated protein Cmr5